MPERIFPEKTLDLPDSLALALAKFLLDKRSGNVTVQIKEGRILGFKTEEIVSIK